MAAIELLKTIFKINCSKFSKAEKSFLENYLFIHLCDELIHGSNKENNLIRLTNNLENTMEDGMLIREMINDILLTEEYTVQGIACYTGFPEDVIYNTSVGMNPYPSLSLSRRIILLHSGIRPEFYSELLRKVIDQSGNFLLTLFNKDKKISSFSE